MIASSIFLFITLILIIAYYWCKHIYSYWQRKGIPFVKPTLIIGNTKEVFTLKTSFGLHLSDIYNDPKMVDEAVVGIHTIHQPGLVIREPELIKSIMIKDFNYFINRYGRSDPHGDPLGNSNIFFARDNYWRDLRTKITPIFTSGKIKQMYPLMLEISAQLDKHLAKHGDQFETDVKEICDLFTTDLIASIAFGINANSFVNPDGEFRTQLCKLFVFTIPRALDFFVAFFLPNFVTLFRVKLFSREFTKFIRSSMSHVMNERERSGEQRNDLIDVLLDIKREAAETNVNDDIANNQDALVAQAAAFLTAGFETSSSTMSFALFELAKHPEIQERLRSEINEAFVKENGCLSYETIMSLEYLTMVVDEVLRLYPVLPFLDREHIKPAGEETGLNLKPYYNYTLPDNMQVFIPIYGIQRDPKHWPNPNKFDPERFSPENKKLHTAMTYLPFGTGPRNCIGSRIGLLQTKIGLVQFLKNHMVKVSDKTPAANEEFDPKAINLQYKNGMHLNVIRDNLYDRRHGPKGN